jgi:TonB family protein
MFGDSLILLLAAAAAPAPSTPPKPTAPPGRWVGVEDYPPAALRHEREGVADFELDVDESGLPGACRVTYSSGEAALDEATCRVAARARFEPARDAAGNPIVSKFASRIAWQIGGPRLHDRGVILTTMDATADGVITHCDTSVQGQVPPSILAEMRSICDEHVMPARSPGRRLAPRYKTMRTRVAYDLDAGPVEDLDPALGNVLYRRVADISVDKKGRQLGCTLVAGTGSEGPLLTTCDQVKAALQGKPAREGPEAHRLRQEFALFGIPR